MLIKNLKKKVDKTLTKMQCDEEWKLKDCLEELQ